MAAELDAFEQFLLNTLRADATLMGLVGSRAYFASGVPQNTVMPYLSVATVSSIDRNALPITTRIFTSPVAFCAVQFTGVGISAARTIFSRMDATLSGATGNITLDGITYRIDQVFRQAEIRLAPTASGGVTYNSRGGEYSSRIERA